jgi:N-acetylglucosamine-6-phosphate deacetylase
MTPTKQSLLFLNARIVLTNQLIERGSLLVQEGLIVGIFPEEATPAIADAAKYDLAGAALFPGFIDLHIHGAAGVDTMNANSADLLRVSRYLATQGVTAWLPTLVPASTEQYERAISSIAALMEKERVDGNSGRPEARVLGVHYEGPFVNSEQCGALHREQFRTFTSNADSDTLPTLADPDAIHFMTLAPEIAGGVELVRHLVGRGWILSIGHTRADFSLLDQAYEAGARHMTHFMNAMPPLHHRSPGPVGWGLSRDDVTCDVIADGVHLDPLMLRLLLKVKSPKRLALIIDAIAAAGLGDGDYQIWGETISVSNGRTRNMHGSIAGSVITMLDAVRLMLSFGVAESDVAQMASTNPARLLRVDDDCGAIEVGKRADLVAIDQEGNVRLTIIGGQVRSAV